MRNINIPIYLTYSNYVDVILFRLYITIQWLQIYIYINFECVQLSNNKILLIMIAINKSKRLNNLLTLACN